MTWMVWNKRKLRQLYGVVLDNLEPNKAEKQARRKKELMWETFLRHYKLVGGWWGARVKLRATIFESIPFYYAVKHLI